MSAAPPPGRPAAVSALLLGAGRPPPPPSPAPGALPGPLGRIRTLVFKSQSILCSGLPSNENRPTHRNVGLVTCPHWRLGAQRPCQASALSARG